LILILQLSLQDFARAAKDFDNLSGEYSLRVIIGDAIVANPIDWIVVRFVSFSLLSLCCLFVYYCNN
jgi:hypothetical protein